MDLADGASLIGRTGWQCVGGSGAAHGGAAVSAAEAASSAAHNQEVAEAIAEAELVLDELEASLLLGGGGGGGGGSGGGASAAREAGEVGMDEVGQIFVTLQAVQRAEELSGFAEPWFEAQERSLVDELMAADRLHDAGYSSADEYRAVLEQVFVAKMQLFQALRERLDACRAQWMMPAQ